MKIDILTLFPDMFDGPFQSSIIGRAVKKDLVSIAIHNIRDYATDKHKKVDDTPYGGGAGMVLKIDVIVAALESILDQKLPAKKKGQKIFLLAAKGEQFNQTQAQELAKLERLVLIAGHYEGVDERLVDFIDGEISIGKYVVTGGELPTMVITDAVVRLLPQVITNASLAEESFSDSASTEYPHYTKPQTFRGKTVPDVLVSGNHEVIRAWRNKQKK